MLCMLPKRTPKCSNNYGDGMPPMHLPALDHVSTGMHCHVLISMSLFCICLAASMEVIQLELPS